MPSPKQTAEITTQQLELFSIDELRAIESPHVSDYFGWWCIEDTAFRGLVSRFDTADLVAHVRHQAEQQPAPNTRALSSQYSKVGEQGDQIAVIEIDGPMMKFASSRGGGTSTVRVRRQIRAAAADPEVGHILVHVDSPGGTYAGTSDLSDDIKNAAGKKPVTYFISDMGASAAYWAGAGATEIVATKTTLVGSIGTFTQVADYSKAAENDGVKVHVIRAGAFKGRTQPGVEIDAEILAEMQATVEKLNNHFVSAVSDGRGMAIDQVRKLADGRIHIAAEALENRLIDRVSTLDEELARIQDSFSNRNRKGKAMSKETTTPAADNPGETKTETPVTELKSAGGPATVQEIKAACPGADPAFVLEQLEASATVETATRNFVTHQNERIKALEENAKANGKRGLADAGIDPLETESSEEHDAGHVQDQFMAKVEEFKARGMSNAKAVNRAVAKYPELHQAMLAANSPV